MRNFTKSTERDIESNQLEWNNSVRFGSSSSQASQSSNGLICRICHCESDPQNPLFSPCYCSGTLKFVHQTCLQQWLTASATSSCELCKFPFIMHTKIKPFNEWRSLDMSGVERRRLLCAILFHAAAAICVVWSLCVLIERAAEEVNRGLIGWPFWTKLVVVTVGLTGGCVFMYIQCKQYLTLCNRWRAKNRILLIQNCPEKVHPPQSPPTHHVSGRMVRRNSSSAMMVGSTCAASVFSANSSCAQTLSSRQHTIDMGGDVGMNPENMGEHDPDQSSSSALTYQHPLSAMNPQSRHYQHHHGQIVANIENSSIHYDRDWTLDDISQASLFKPCSGSQTDSLTPYHEPMTDSQSNIYNNASSSGGGSHHPTSSSIYNNPNINLQNCSVSTSSYEKIKSSSSQKMPNLGGNDMNVFKVKTSKHPAANSAVFVENRDILNDGGTLVTASGVGTGYNPKIYHRHSTATDYYPMTALSSSVDFYENLDERIGPQPRQEPANAILRPKDTRRYSDTKLLLQQQHEQHLQQYSNLCAGPSANYRMQQHQKSNNKYYNNPNRTNPNKAHNNNNNNLLNLTNVWGPETSSISDNSDEQHKEPEPQISDIIFENSQDSDPLELNIQELLELDIEYQNSSHGRRVLGHDNSFKRLRSSADNVLANAGPVDGQRNDRIGDIRTTVHSSDAAPTASMMYKSLPNLIAGSSENLLP